MCVFVLAGGGVSRETSKLLGVVKDVGGRNELDGFRVKRKRKIDGFNDDIEITNANRSELD